MGTSKLASLISTQFRRILNYIIFYKF